MLNNKNDIKILRKLYADKKINKFKSYTIKQLTEALKNKVSEMKVRQTLNMCLEQGFVELGFKSGRSNTYFITQKGIDILIALLESEFKLKNKGE